MPIKTTKLKDILTREQVYPETNVASIVDFDENVDHVSVSDTGTATAEAKYITVNGIEKKIAGSDLSGFDVNTQTASEDPYLTSLTFKGNTYRVAGDASKDLEEEIARAKAKEQELLEYITFLYSQQNLTPGAAIVAEEEDGTEDTIVAENDDTGETETLIMDEN